MRTSNVRTLRSPTARRMQRTFPGKSWAPLSISIIGAKATYRNLPNALTARKLVGRRSAWRVSSCLLRLLLLRDIMNWKIFCRISLRMVWIHFPWRMSSLCLSRMHFWHASAYLFATSCCFDSTNWSANGSNNRSSSEEQGSSYDTWIFMP
jgi:hypothetical protein